MLGMLCHLLAFAGYVIPFGNIAGPLILWLIKKDESEYVNHHGRESLNFQITITIAMVIATILVFALIGVPLLIALGIADVVFVVIASVKAYGGERYRYPFRIEFIR
jgi:uncharacterized Tic20 family protein